jgi:hypothetical protein
MQEHEDIYKKIVDFLYSKKGHIADLAEVMAFLEGGSISTIDADALLKTMQEEGIINIAVDSVFLSSDRYLPKVKCLICDGIIKRDELVPFYREKHFPFVRWGFHKGCLEGGALDEMLSSGMFRMEDGKIFPDYDYGEERGKNPVTIAIRYLRSEDFMYFLEIKSSGKK